MPSLKINSEPLVSVIVPSYNHQKYVIECLESIKNLNYGRLELIVSDDCSPDCTFTLAEEWVQRNAGRFERALVIRQGQNIGLVRNMQFLYDSSQGDYLACIASDDLFIESAIAGRVAMLQENPNIDAVFGNAQRISSSGTVLEKEFISKQLARELSSSRFLVSSLLINWWVPGPVLMLRKEAVLENGSLGQLPADLKAEDRYIYTRLAARGKLRFVNEVVAKYRAVPGSLSAPAGFALKSFIQSDQRNKHLLKGYDRLVIEARIARMSIDFETGGIVSRVKKLLLQAVGLLLRTSLYIGPKIFRS